MRSGASATIKFTRQIGKIHKLSALIGGGIATVAAIFVRILTENPRVVLHRLAAYDRLPPLWLLSILWLGWFFLLGATTAILLCASRRDCRREALLWRGSTFLVLTVVISLIWYTLLFGKFSLLISWLCLPVAIAAALLCALSWWRTAGWAGVLLVGFALWLLCLFLLQFAVMLHN